MCFHASLTAPKNHIEERFSAPFQKGVQYTPYFHRNGFDYGMLYVLPQEAPNAFVTASWGMLPTEVANVQEFRKQYNTLNAKQERLLEGGLWEEVIATKRCLIVADGFFESKQVNGATYPYYIHLPKREVFAFAGVYNQHRDGSLSCSIITTVANDFMETIHNTKKRMPIILDRSIEDQWLSNNLSSKEVQGFLKESFTQNPLTAYPVAKDLTNPKKESNHSGILTPFYYPQLDSLF